MNYSELLLIHSYQRSIKPAGKKRDKDTKAKLWEYNV